MKKQNGITLIALVISIIVMLILAGVSINAIVGENGVLTKAQNAKLTSEEAARMEELELILFEYNSSEFLGESDGFAAFLADKKADGTIQDYIYLDNLIIKYKDKYYEAETDGEYYSISGRMEDNLTGGGLSNDYIITPDNLTNNMEFQAGSSYVVLDKVSGEDFNFEIPAGDPVTIKLVGDMTIDNKGYKRSAIDLAEGATLNLHIYGNVEVNSGYGEDASGITPGKGGYAGIHVPEGSILNLYGTGTIRAIGGNAGSGGETIVVGQQYGGAGGGGAGAGIGGNGGTGGAGTAGQGISGGAGENCGNVNIYNDITVYAYGGGGGSGAKGNLSASTAGGGGGYPAAGIGGGGAAGAGGTCCAGAGGFSGGSANGDERDRAVNGLAGNGGTDDSTPPVYDDFSGGGGYFEGGEGIDQNGIDRQIVFLGGAYSQGWTCPAHSSGSGGVAGNGGNIKVSEKAKVYAYNGNLYTDGTSYENGLNQCPIYAQNGIIVAKYEYTAGNSSTFTLQLISNQSTMEKLNYINTKYIENSNKRYITKNSILTNVDMSTQGIGSGAGYIETSNGTYTIDSSMN